MDNIPFTPRSKKILALATKVARHQGHEYVGTEHLLAGMILEGEGIAAHLLLEKEVTLNLLCQKAGFSNLMTPEQEAIRKSKIYDGLIAEMRQHLASAEALRAKLDL